MNPKMFKDVSRSSKFNNDINMKQNDILYMINMINEIKSWSLRAAVTYYFWEKKIKEAEFNVK